MEAGLADWLSRVFGSWRHTVRPSSLQPAMSGGVYGIGHGVISLSYGGG